MNIQFLEKLSNADGIASNEQEVRDVLVDELKEYADEVSTDHLGSIIFILHVLMRSASLFAVYPIWDRSC